MHREPIRNHPVAMLIAVLTVSIVDAMGASHKSSTPITAPVPKEPALSVKVNSDLVQIPVTVTNKADQVVEHLSKEMFLIYEIS